MQKVDSFTTFNTELDSPPKGNNIDQENPTPEKEDKNLKKENKELYFENYNEFAKFHNAVV